jgi:hypothetical protein
MEHGAWSMSICQRDGRKEESPSDVYCTGHVRTAVVVLDEDDGISGWLSEVIDNLSASTPSICCIKSTKKTFARIGDGRITVQQTHGCHA